MSSRAPSALQGASSAKRHDARQDYLLEVNDALRASLSARDAFLAVAAHELRNPLTPILGHLELLQAGVRAGRLSPGEIERKLEHLATLMTQYSRRAATLLDVSHLTTGTLALSPEVCDLSAVLRGVIDSLSAAAGKAGSSIALRAPDSLVGRWDRRAAEQVVDNLLSNALKYGSRSSSSSPIEVDAAAAADDAAVLTIRDHGAGMSARDKRRLSDCFDDAVGASERRSGFGAGLWIAGQLVAAMGGHIAVDDPPGGGARLSITLPRRSAA